MNDGLHKRPDGLTLYTGTFVWDMHWSLTALAIWLRSRMEARPSTWTMFAGQPYRVISLATWPELGTVALEQWDYHDWLMFIESVVTARWWEPLPRDLDELFGGSYGELP